jgi:hypothetical protein
MTVTYNIINKNKPITKLIYIQNQLFCINKVNLSTNNKNEFNINKEKIHMYREGLGKPKGYANNNRYILSHHELSGLPPRDRPYLVLGIESSCDDTGVAIVRSDGTTLSNSVYSQYAVHEKFGGIVPSLAMEAHKTNIDKALKDALNKAGLNSVNDVDAIAVTKGPGSDPSYLYHLLCDYNKIIIIIIITNYLNNILLY